ncbi:unnamed protein product [Heligmosomoides polygyrus]|uniref:Phage protein n=1 Tax=Heligmosomoides polygyrus TaxID=6339 RepID=A0A183F675_HELPZ|nr:unnamed protein product [Heligmosomoides polygyrus]
MAKAPQTKQTAKNVEDVAKATHYSDVYEEPESCDGEWHLYQFAKKRHCQAEVIKFFGINNENYLLFTDRKEAMKRWCDHYEEI